MCGSANFAYVHAFKLTELEDSTIQVFQGFTIFTIDFQGVNKHLQLEMNMYTFFPSVSYKSV